LPKRAKRVLERCSSEASVKEVCEQSHATCVNKAGVNKVGVNKAGVNKAGVNKAGVNKAGAP